MSNLDIRHFLYTYRYTTQTADRSVSWLVPSSEQYREPMVASVYQQQAKLLVCSLAQPKQFKICLPHQIRVLKSTQRQMSWNQGQIQWRSMEILKQMSTNSWENQGKSAQPHKVQSNFDVQHMLYFVHCTYILKVILMFNVILCINKTVQAW